jgi:predicted Rossmann fold nucleotide-binding protein DprA/Smf involved in DNA uptake
VSIDDFVARVAGEREVVGTGDGAAGKGRTDGTEAPDAPREDEAGHRPPSLEERALATLEQDALLVDDLAERLAVSVSTALALLTTLELHGEVVRLPGMRFRKAA